MAGKVYFIFLLLLLGVSFSGLAQNDSLSQVYIAHKNMEELQNEQKELDFQNFFFEALQQKAIGNFDKAITALENCQSIKNNDPSVEFEFAKNYFELDQYYEAEIYIKKALEKVPKNLYMLVLLKDILNNQKNFKEALEVQKKILEQDPNSQLDLVSLYIKNHQIDNAKQLLIDLEKSGMLSPNLMLFKDSLLKGGVSIPTTTTINKPLSKQSIKELKKTYRTNISFAVLKELLKKLYAEKLYLDLENFSKEAIDLFPAQPLVYLMNATTLNQKKDYNNALNVLETGFDYVVDDVLLEADFYEQMSLSYKGMSQNVNASKYYNKAVALRLKKS